MVNLEMIGWDPDRQLNARATGTSPAWDGVLERASAATGIAVTTRTPQLTNDTDHYGFGVRGVPAIHFGVGGSRERYHAVSDEAAGVDYEALADRTRFVLATLVEIADLDERPPFSGEIGPDPGITGTNATAAELDMLGLDPGEGGIKLTAVAMGLSAQRAGLRPGDLIVEVNGELVSREPRRMRALYELAREASPGDSVVLSVLRESRRIEFTLRMDR